MFHQPTQICIGVRIMMGRLYPPVLDGIACEPMRDVQRYLQQKRDMEATAARQQIKFAVDEANMKVFHGARAGGKARKRLRARTV